MRRFAPQKMLPYVSIPLFICLGATGQLLLKSGLGQLPQDASTAVTMTAMFRNVRVFSGLACYVVSTLFYLVALKAFDLSFTYPMIAASYAIVVVLSWKILGEGIPLLRIVAVAVILAGVGILALSYKDNDAERAPPAATASVMESTDSDT